MDDRKATNNQKGFNTASRERFIRMSEVKHTTGLSRATIYKKIKEGTFPAPVKLGARASAWVAGEVYDWQKSRPRATQPNE